MSVDAELFVKAPIIGRVSLVKAKGSLDNGVEVQVNVVVATGTVNLTAPLKGANHVLTFRASLDVTLLGHIDTGEYAIVTLP